MIKSKYLLPKMNELFDQFVGASYFLQLDLMNGCYQLEVDSRDHYKIASVTQQEQYVWKVISFGLTNALSIFQMLMNDTLQGCIGQRVIVYLVNILVRFKSEQEHIMQIRQVFGQSRTQVLYAKKSMRRLLQSSIKFLGYQIGKNGIHVDGSKVDTSVKWSKPMTLKEALSFMATCLFFKRFIPSYQLSVSKLI
ncbi:reverse transcriptase family protein PWA37_000541 [Arxiozyma heterogenica]|uniref:reverse transcriptase family protein n=1 Tax=Arxiozyma heterogenica TaxID=278026 RepID=UPI002F0A59E9